MERLHNVYSLYVHNVYSLYVHNVYSLYVHNEYVFNLPVTLTLPIPPHCCSVPRAAYRCAGPWPCEDAPSC